MMKQPSLVSLAFFLVLPSCGASNTNSNSTGAAGGEEPENSCVGSSDPSLAGEAKPIDELEFRNAFDPSDKATYDPSAAGALPGPVMVDTWGDRSSGAHGTLGVFPPGFSAPPHVHSHGYYGVVLAGEMSNPFGEKLSALLDSDEGKRHGDVRLPAGSMWHVPAGSQHTTTCVGPDVCWFYFHSEDAFDFTPLVDETGALQSGVSLESAHIDAVLLPRSELVFAGEEGSFVEFAPGFGEQTGSAHGTFGLFNAGATSPPHVHSEDYYGVVIAGIVTNPFNFEQAPARLTTGGTWSVPEKSAHVTACEAGEDCLFYFHSRGAFDFSPLCE